MGTYNNISISEMKLLANRVNMPFSRIFTLSRGINPTFEQIGSRIEGIREFSVVDSRSVFC